MKIKVQFESQLRQAAGTDHVTIEAETGLSIRDLFAQLRAQSPPEIATRLVDSAGNPSRSILVFVNNEHVATDQFEQTTITDADSIQLVPPIAGG